MSDNNTDNRTPTMNRKLSKRNLDSSQQIKMI